MSERWCGTCGKECDARIVDEGIGHYEFWGRKGIDTRLCLVSDCCDTEMYDDEDLQIECMDTPEDHKRDEEDYKADAAYHARYD